MGFPSSVGTHCFALDLLFPSFPIFLSCSFLLPPSSFSSSCGPDLGALVDQFGEFLRASLFCSLRPSYCKPPAPTQLWRTEKPSQIQLLISKWPTMLSGTYLSTVLGSSVLRSDATMLLPCCTHAVHNVAIGGLSPSICNQGCLIT